MLDDSGPGRDSDFILNSLDKKPVGGVAFRNIHKKEETGTNCLGIINFSSFLWNPFSVCASNFEWHVGRAQKPSHLRQLLAQPHFQTLI